MIDFISYNEMLNWWNLPNEKIKCVIFYKENCPYCDDFVPHVLEEKLIEKSQHFDVRKVCVDTGGNPFPPYSTPMVYFSIPNTTEKMPLLRTGGATPDVVEEDLNSMINMKEQGLTIQQAFFDGKSPVMSTWVQRLFGG
jgi:hypothetical protein